MTWELVSRSGAWYYTSDELRELAKSCGTELPEKFQGENSLFQFIESDEKLTKTLHKYFVDMIVGKDEIQNA
jgi:hypothetical protein